MLVFGENESRCLSSFLWKFQKTRAFWKFAHISRTYNQINYRDIWFAKATIIFMMMAQVLFFDIFSEKDSHLNTVVVPQFSRRKKNCLIKIFPNEYFCPETKGNKSHHGIWHTKNGLSTNFFRHIFSKVFISDLAKEEVF